MHSCSLIDDDLSYKRLATSLITIVFVTMHAVGLAVLAIWFVGEQWEFRHHSGDVGKRLTHHSHLLSMLDWFTQRVRNMSSFVTGLRVPEVVVLEPSRPNTPLGSLDEESQKTIDWRTEIDPESEPSSPAIVELPPLSTNSPSQRSSAVAFAPQPRRGSADGSPRAARQAEVHDRRQLRPIITGE